MKKTQILGLGLAIVIGFSGCLDNKENQEAIESKKVWNDIKKDVVKIKQERKDEEAKRKAEQAKKELEEFWNKSAEEGKKSSFYKKLDIHNNE